MNSVHDGPRMDVCPFGLAVSVPVTTTRRTKAIPIPAISGSSSKSSGLVDLSAQPASHTGVFVATKSVDGEVGRSELGRTRLASRLYVDGIDVDSSCPVIVSRYGMTASLAAERDDEFIGCL